MDELGFLSYRCGVRYKASTSLNLGSLGITPFPYLWFCYVIGVSHW